MWREETAADRHRKRHAGHMEGPEEKGVKRCNRTIHRSVENGGRETSVIQEAVAGIRSSRWRARRFFSPARASPRIPVRSVRLRKRSLSRSDPSRWPFKNLPPPCKSKKKKKHLKRCTTRHVTSRHAVPRDATPRRASHIGFTLHHACPLYL